MDNGLSPFNDEFTDGFPGDGNRCTANVWLLASVWTGRFYLARRNQNLEHTLLQSLGGLPLTL